MKRKLALLAMSSLVLIGCAGGPVGWGGTHQTMQANDKFVTYLYDPLVGGRSAAMNAASEHCRVYGKNAIPTMSGNQGILQIQTYECISPQGNVTNAQAQSDQLTKKLDTAFSSWKKCNEELAQSPSGQQVTKAMLVLSMDQANKYDLYSSKSKLNEQQRKLLSGFLADQSKCRKILSDGVSGTPYASILAKRYSELDSVYVQLLSGKISIGEANLSREQVFIKSNQELAQADKSLGDSFKASHEAEISKDNEARSRLADAYRANEQANQQQQIINQQNYLIQQQIMRQNMPKPAPAPIQTNCYRIGNSVSCTTQ